ncbi:hypothetical protein L3V65_01900 [Heyndrickxia coagulans]|uniref:O-antigen ligase family protein n=1 Tax=Heyndrickxia coagulans TaxID=1398 RepID=UPI001F28018B|nr:O-antigen ligase family protein [Heyndrickxia coagulans]UJZ87816.1 hypothetical protein L3V65_01900 [Heyndrickxia coagulans]
MTLIEKEQSVSLPKIFISGIEYFLALFLILQNRSIFSATNDINFYTQYIVIILMMLLLIVLWKDLKLSKPLIAYFFIFIGIYYIYIFLFMFINVNYDSRSFVGQFIVFFPLMLFFLLFYQSNGYNLLIKISNIMVLLSLISIVMWTLASVLGVLHSNNFVSIHWGIDRYIKNYYYIYFETQLTNIGSFPIYRNSGIFTEGPMYTLNLTLALIIELFIRNKVKLKNIIILFITILTTLTTTGIVMTVVIFLAKYLIPSKGREKKKLSFKPFILPIVGILAIIIIQILLNSKSDSASYSIRLDDFVAAFKAWKENFIFGVGYNQDDPIVKYMSSFRSYNTGFSNSIMIVLAQGGIYLFIVYLIPFFLSIIQSFKLRSPEIFMTSISIAILFITTSFPYTLMLITFVSLGYASPFYEKASSISRGVI